MKKVNNNTASALLTATGLGAVAAMAVSILFCAIGATLISVERVGEGSSDIITVITLSSSSAIGAIAANRKCSGHKLILSFGTGIMYMLMLLGTTAMFFGGRYQAIGTTILPILGGCGAAMLLGMRQKSPKVHRSKYRNSKLVQNRQRGN